MSRLKIAGTYGLLFIVAIALYWYWSYQSNSSRMNVCLIAADELLSPSYPDQSILRSSCSCAREKMNGKLPDKYPEWKESGTRSASLALIECSRDYLIESDGKRKSSDQLKKRLINQGYGESDVRKIARCVAEGTYSEMHRAAASNGRIDEISFAKMHLSCESIPKSSMRGSK